jgi:hypothetical protein
MAQIISAEQFKSRYTQIKERFLELREKFPEDLRLKKIGRTIM